MAIWSSFKTGLNATKRYWRMLLLLFVINFAAALLLTMPLRGFLNETIGNRLAADEIAFNLNFDYIADLLVNYLEALKSSYSSPFIVTAVVLYLVLSTFLAGGVLGSFNAPEEKFSLRSFFAYCGSYFWAFFRLFLISLIFLVIIFAINGGLKKGFSALLEDSPNEPLVFALWLIRHIVFLFLFFFINMVFDYAKIRAVVKGESSMWRAALGSFPFVFRHVGQTLGLYYLIGFFAIVLFAVYFSVAHYALPATMVIVLLLWQQLYNLARVGIRMLFFSSQLGLYRSLT